MGLCSKTKRENQTKGRHLVTNQVGILPSRACLTWLRVESGPEAELSDGESRDCADNTGVPRPVSGPAIPEASLSLSIIIAIPGLFSYFVQQMTTVNDFNPHRLSVSKSSVGRNLGLVWLGSPLRGDKVKLRWSPGWGSHRGRGEPATDSVCLWAEFRSFWLQDWGPCFLASCPAPRAPRVPDHMPPSIFKVSNRGFLLSPIPLCICSESLTSLGLGG